MITLNSTTDKLQLYIPLAITTNNINCYVAYRDTTTTSISPIGYTISSSGNTTIDLVSPPSSNRISVLLFFITTIFSVC